MVADHAVLPPARGAAFVRGPLLTVATAVLVEALSYTPAALPVPHPVMLAAVVYGSYVAGWRSGMASVALMVLYTVHNFSPGYPIELSDEDQRRIVVLALSAPMIVMVVDRLRRRADRLQAIVAEQAAQLRMTVAELREGAEALAAEQSQRSEFLAVLTHQIRAPLANLRGTAECLRLRCGSDVATAHVLDMADEQVAALDQVVSGLIGVVRADRNGFDVHAEPVSVLPLIERAVLCSAPSTAPTIDVDTPPPLVMADPELLLVVLANLLDNACKYGGGATRIAVRSLGRRVEVQVVDDGPGIPDGQRERVFDKYYRVDGSDRQIAYGYGLGLHICRQLLAAQSGTVRVASAARGCTVAFSLPVAP